MLWPWVQPIKENSLVPWENVNVLYTTSEVQRKDKAFLVGPIVFADNLKKKKMLAMAFSLYVYMDGRLLPYRNELISYIDQYTINSLTLLAIV